MKIGTLVLMTVIMVIALVGDRAGASEKLLFADLTEGTAFHSLLDFFTRELHMSVIVPTENLPMVENAIVSQNWEKLSLLGNLLFLAYEKDSLYFVELIDFHPWREILSLVRKKEDQKTMEQDIKERVRKIFSTKPGIKIIFPRQNQSQFSLVALDPMGKTETTLTQLEFGPIENISVSSDFQMLVFTVNHGYKKGVYLFRFLDHTIHPLTPWERNDYSPSFWEKEQKIVFVSQRGSKKGIFTMNLDGSSQKLFAEKENPVDWPSFSPDGRRLLYCELIQGQWTLKIWDLFSQKEETVGFTGNVFQPAFSFDGQKIIFVGETDGNYDLYIVTLREKNFIRLTVDNFPKAHPAPSPDNRWIVFRGQKEGNNWDIFLLDLYQKNLVHRLTASISQEGDPVFTPYPIF